MSIETVDADESGSGETVGEAVRRREDPHLLAGDAEYVDDIQYPGTTHLAILRSQYAHAHIESIDTSAAEDADGVLAVYTREDLLADGLDGTIPGDDPDHGVSVDRPFLAGEKTRYQGDPIAGVVAEDRYVAHDALDLIEVEYERLDAVPDVSAALDDDAPTIHEEAPDNVAFEWDEGEREATMAAFDGADRVVEIDLSINKVIAVPLETRAAVARYDAADGDLHVELGCQSVLGVQDHLSDVLGVPEHRVHVRAPDVGGAFGVKAQPYTGHIFAAWCSMQLERPVKWVATRTEAFTSTNHSRRHDLTARAALDDGGRITGLHVDSLADVGGYMTSGGAGVPTGAFGTRLLGEYDIPAAYVEVTGAFTNTTTLSAYRGAGRPEAAYVIERLASACARELGEDPVEFRRRNFIDPDDFPYETPFGSTYDSGDYEKPLDRALELVDYENLRERQAEAREEGRYLGIGFSSYIEACGVGPGLFSSGNVQFKPSGRVIVRAGTHSHGQGHRTSFAQIVADRLGVPYDDIEVIEGDTAMVPEGNGTYGSRSGPVAGSAIVESAEKIVSKARRIAAHQLEAAPEDVAFEDGEFHVAGAPDRSISIREIAGVAYSRDELPEDVDPGLEATSYYDPPNFVFPFGTHVAVVEVDPDSGETEFERYVAVDDVGNQINPKIVEGQIHGGIAQGIGQALSEEAVYDDNGNLLTGSLQDYAMPKAEHVPEMEWDSTVTPCPHNPLGVKGVGEAGAIAAPPAVVNAVVDALEPFGVENIDMPLSPETVWTSISEAD